MTTNRLTIDLDLSQLFYGSELRGDEAIPTPLLTGIVKEIAQHYMSEIGMDLRREAETALKQAVRSQMDNLVGETIAKTLQPTDHYGRPIGEPRTLESVIVEEGVKYLQKTEGYGRDSITMARKFIREEVERRFAAELSEAMKQAKQEVIEAVKAKGAEVLAQTIAAMAGVR